MIKECVVALTLWCAASPALCQESAVNTPADVVNDGDQQETRVVRGDTTPLLGVPVDNSDRVKNFFVNGIDSNPSNALARARQFCVITGRPVTLFYSMANSGDVATAVAPNLIPIVDVFNTITGNPADKQIQDHLAHPQAVQRLSERIVECCAAAERVNVIGESAGADVVAYAVRQALRDYTALLLRDRGSAVQAVLGLPEAARKAQEAFHKCVRVITVAGAASRKDFPPCVPLVQVVRFGDTVVERFNKELEPIGGFDPGLDFFTSKQHTRYFCHKDFDAVLQSLMESFDDVQETLDRVNARLGLESAKGDVPWKWSAEEVSGTVAIKLLQTPDEDSWLDAAIGTVTTVSEQ